MLRCLGSCNSNGRSHSIKNPCRQYRALSGGMVSGNNKKHYGTVCFSSPFVALRPFHWAAAGLKGIIYTTDYIIPR